MTRLLGKVALITGGTSGIGAATAQRFLEEKAIVIATGSSQASVEAARQRMPGVEFVVSDAGDLGAVAALVEHVKVTHGRIDVLFANAGVGKMASIEETDEGAFDTVLNINFRGSYFLLQHAVPAMTAGGSIILTSSAAAVSGIADTSLYGATKAALSSLGRSLAVELAPRKIRVNTITPGPVATNIGAKMDLNQAQIDGFAEMIATIPLRRIGDADEVASAALYFASDESAFTTGADLRVDGGLTLG